MFAIPLMLAQLAIGHAIEPPPTDECTDYPGGARIHSIHYLSPTLCALHSFTVITAPALGTAKLVVITTSYITSR